MLYVKIRFGFFKEYHVATFNNPIEDLIAELNRFVPASALKADAEKNLRTLVQSTFQRLDLVSREEFDAQKEVLKRTRNRVESLEKEIDSLTDLLKSVSDNK